ncbi:MAG: AAA domain-containing protein [Betaproteobacteria bacterium]|nr:AAA domain-containing protein [Betaproteobacteria bacterium]
MLGRSPAFRAADQLITRIASCDAPVLIEGETGTGKELAARAVHYRSARRDRPFVPVNCGAMPDALIENELFGHAKGAFTDAKNDQTGLVALAHGGTLFLDEVDALSPKGQVSLLRFLQDQEYRPLGSHRTRAADVRIVTASNRDLARLVEDGGFRADLLYRIKLIYLELPPLRARPEDVALLARHFLGRANARFGTVVERIDPGTLDWFRRYPWPGNVRELENLVLREGLLADGPTLSIRAPAGVAPPRTSPVTGPGATCETDFNRAKARAIDEFERRYLAELLSRTEGNVSVAARIAGKERRSLGKLLKKHGIDRDSFRP